MRTVYVCVTTLLVLAHIGVPTVAAGRRRKTFNSSHDGLFVARCDAKCFYQKLTRNQCVKECLSTSSSKSGTCVTTSPTRPVFAAACLNACTHDTQCPGILKCCKHTCGVTCQIPDGLDSVSGLPPIPTNITLSERRRGRVILIRWTTNTEHSTSETLTRIPIVYMLEERHHAGKHFTESRLGSWNPRHRSFKPSVLLKHVVKPGRWYQFRVAAVNENGTRGYSRPSAKFITSLGPRAPGPPTNMSVGPLKMLNGSLYGELRWQAPSSDLPVQRYKIFWSRRLHGAIALNSVLVHHHTVSKDQTKFELKKLQPNSQYFLQVQALAQFGKERLKGEKSALVLNTTNYINETEWPKNIANNISNENRRMKYNLKIEGLHIQRINWHKNELLARVSWKNMGFGYKYIVTWSKELCQNLSKDEPIYLQLAATTKSSHIDIYNLEFRCKYKISVREMSQDKLRSLQESTITFTTPSCEQIAAKVSKDKLQCQG